MAVIKKQYSELTILKNITLFINGRVYLYDATLPEWSRPAPFYGFKCRIHGYVVSRPRGRDAELRCPDCERGPD